MRPSVNCLVPTEQMKTDPIFDLEEKWGICMFTILHAFFMDFLFCNWRFLLLILVCFLLLFSVYCQLLNLIISLMTAENIHHDPRCLGLSGLCWTESPVLVTAFYFCCLEAATRSSEPFIRSLMSSFSPTFTRVIDRLIGSALNRCEVLVQTSFLTRE